MKAINEIRSTKKFHILGCEIERANEVRLALAAKGYSLVSLAHDPEAEGLYTVRVTHAGCILDLQVSREWDGLKVHDVRVILSKVSLVITRQAVLDAFAPAHARSA